jgi:hypothetical protein
VEASPVSPVRDYLRTGRASLPPLITTLFRHAAVLNGVEPEELIGDPARLTRALLDMQRLLQTDVVTVKLGGAIQAASGVDMQDAVAGSANPLSCVPQPEAVIAAAEPLIDTIRRLAADLKRRIPLLAVIPGPMALTAGLDGEASQIAAVLRTLAEAACKAGASVILLDEAEAAAADPSFARLAAPIVNTARYYTASVVVSGTPSLPKTLADGLLVDAADLSRIAKGQRRGLRVDLNRVDDAVATLAQYPGAADAIFISVDDASLEGLTIEAIGAAFDRLRAIALA